MQTRMQLLPLDAAVAFRAGDDRVVYSVDRPDSREWQIREVFASRSGQPFHRLVVPGAGDLQGTFQEHSITHGAETVLRRRGDLVEVDGVTYALTVPPREITVADRPRELTWQPSAAAFRAQDRWFVYLLDSDDADLNGRAILSLDGQTFHDLTDDGFSGTGRDHTWRFADPFHGSAGQALRCGDQLVVDRTTFAPHRYRPSSRECSLHRHARRGIYSSCPAATCSTRAPPWGQTTRSGGYDCGSDPPPARARASGHPPAARQRRRGVVDVSIAETKTTPQSSIPTPGRSSSTGPTPTRTRAPHSTARR